MGILYRLLFVLVFSFQVSAFANENIISCTETGDQTHRFLKTDDGYRLEVDFRMYYIRPNFDPNTGAASGHGAIGIDVPLENDSVRTTSMRWINEKNAFFQELFPPTELPTEDAVSTGQIRIDLKESDCVVKKVDELVFASCRAEGPMDINGVEIKNIDFSMQNQVRRTLLNDLNNPEELVVSEVDAVYANVSFHKVKGYGTYIYRSSMTYYPNQNDIMCYIGK